MRPSTRRRKLDAREVERLVARHQESVWRYLVFLGCTPETADDLCQETFLALLRRSEDLADVERLASYLRRIARNLYLKHENRKHREPAAADLIAAAGAVDAFEGDDRGRGYIEALRSCLSALPEHARVALGLRYGEGLSRDAIAARLVLSPDGVKSLLARAKARLRACIERRRRET